MDEDGEPAGLEPQARRGGGVERLRHVADLHEVIPAPHGAELGLSALLGAVGDGAGVGALERPVRFDGLEIGGNAEPVLHGPARPITQHPFELRRCRMTSDRDAPTPDGIVRYRASTSAPRRGRASLIESDVASSRTPQLMS